jgi:hypothetical protein
MIYDDLFNFSMSERGIKRWMNKGAVVFYMFIYQMEKM